VAELLPQAAVRCFLTGFSTVHLSFAMAMADALATCRGGLMPQAAAKLPRCTERLSFAMALAGAFAALRRPSRGRQAAPSALPGPAPAPLAAARCLHSLSPPDGPASIRSCSTPPLAASMPLALEAFSRSASGDGASHPPLQAMIFSQPPRGGKIFKVRSGCAALSKPLSCFLSPGASAWLKDF